MEIEQNTDAELELTIQPTTSWYASDDDRWIAQVADLATALEREVGVLRPVPLVPGTKGAPGVVEVLILALTAAKVRAFLDLLDVFLSRDRHRSVDLAWTGRDGSRQKLALHGAGMRSKELERIMTKAIDAIQRSDQDI